jgi:mRNA-degrading endonuclease RelE of RelBE toxin-antitoxin system
MTYELLLWVNVRVKQSVNNSECYRLVYEVRDSQLIVVVAAVGKRERNAVYKTAEGRQ